MGAFRSHTHTNNTLNSHSRHSLLFVCSFLYPQTKRIGFLSLFFSREFQRIDLEKRNYGNNLNKGLGNLNAKVWFFWLVLTLLSIEKPPLWNGVWYLLYFFSFLPDSPLSSLVISVIVSQQDTLRVVSANDFIIIDDEVKGAHITIHKPKRNISGEEPKSGIDAPIAILVKSTQLIH